MDAYFSAFQLLVQQPYPPMPREDPFWGWDNHVVSFPFGWLGLIILLVVIVVLFVYLARKGASCRLQPTSRDILSKRYARGEIDREEYERMKQDVGGD